MMPMDDDNDAGKPTSAVVAAQPSAALVEAQKALPEAALGAAREYAKGAWAESTVRVYRYAWTEFVGWCREHGRSSMPADPETVAVYLHWLAKERRPSLSRAAIEQRASAICWAHDLAEKPSPTRAGPVRLVLKAVRNEKGRRPARRVAPLTDDVLGRLLGVLDRGTARGKLHAALLLVGQGGAFRRSELVGLDRDDVVELPEGKGFRVLVRRSKTDQEGEGQTKGLPAIGGPLCPAGALREWLAVRGERPGPLFKSMSQSGILLSNRLPKKKVALIVKALAKKAGVTADLSGHSLRSGFITQALRDGADAIQVQRQTGHQDLNSLLAYIREENPMTNNAVEKIAAKRKGEAGATATPASALGTPPAPGTGEEG